MSSGRIREEQLSATGRPSQRQQQVGQVLTESADSCHSRHLVHANSDTNCGGMVASRGRNVISPQ